MDGRIPAGDRGSERDAQVRPAFRAAGDGDAAVRPIRPWGDALLSRTYSGVGIDDVYNKISEAAERF